MSKLYVASSWRNAVYPAVVEQLRADGFEVYDFRNPGPGEHGFSWRECIDTPKPWDLKTYERATSHPRARAAFANDERGMLDADAAVLVLDAGKSAHMELGWFMGRLVPVVIYMPEPVEPELMYLLGGPRIRFVEHVTEIDDALGAMGIWP